VTLPRQINETISLARTKHKERISNSVIALTAQGSVTLCDFRSKKSTQPLAQHRARNAEGLAKTFFV